MADTKTVEVTLNGIKYTLTFSRVPSASTQIVIDGVKWNVSLNKVITPDPETEPEPEPETEPKPEPEPKQEPEPNPTTTPTPETGSGEQTEQDVLSATLTYNGQTFTVSSDKGTDLGNYTSSIGGFTQRCIRADITSLSMTVFFRPDLDGKRQEVVFELGRLFGSTNLAAEHMGAYTVEIKLNGNTIANTGVPAHYWNARWRWQSAPRPIKVSVDDLLSRKLLPPYKRSLRSTGAKPITFQPMTLAWVTPYMPQTGERDDIGPVTGPQGRYIVTGDKNELALTMAQAEASGTCTWHMRDETTSAPIDLLKNPKATWYERQDTGTPWVFTPAAPQVDGNRLTMDSAHMPALTYLPYMLTGDPYYLEELQFQGTWAIGSSPPAYRQNSRDSGIGQSRAFAWTMRTLAHCVIASPTNPPSWMLSQNYFRTLLNDNLLMFTAKYVNGPDPVRSIFRACGNIVNSRNEPGAPGGTWVDPWQDEFVATILGWMVWSGQFPEWKEAFDWVSGSTKARTAAPGVTGWVRAVATPYRLIVKPAAGQPTVQTWGEAWQLTKLHQQYGDIADPNYWLGNDMTYLHYSRGSLVMIDKISPGTVTESLSWATKHLDDRGWKIPEKWQIG